jgi:hypothetical protein
VSVAAPGRNRYGHPDRCQPPRPGSTRVSAEVGASLLEIDQGDHQDGAHRGMPKQDGASETQSVSGAIRGSPPLARDLYDGAGSPPHLPAKPWAADPRCADRSDLRNGPSAAGHQELGRLSVHQRDRAPGVPSAQVARRNSDGAREHELETPDSSPPGQV